MSENLPDYNLKDWSQFKYYVTADDQPPRGEAVDPEPVSSTDVLERMLTFSNPEAS